MTNSICCDCSRTFCAPNKRQRCDECKFVHRSNRPSRPHKERGPFSCRHCDKEYMTLRSIGEGETYCSRGCAFSYKTLHKSGFVTSGDGYRRAKSRGSVAIRFNIFDIFERDKWRCNACGVKTPLRFRGTYAGNAPELDHVIPISKGGPHTKENTQCLCRTCNRSKGAGSLNDQLIMFG